MSDIQEKIKKAVEDHQIILFMKGSKLLPLCGFSARVVTILDHYNLPYETWDVLQDDALRQEVKAFSNWPTFPQLYINGKFIGGCDIVVQLHEEGKLTALLNETVIDSNG